MWSTMATSSRSASTSDPTVGAAELLERWRLDLESWAIPAEILATTNESPWVLPRQVFTPTCRAKTGGTLGPVLRACLGGSGTERLGPRCRRRGRSCQPAARAPRDLDHSRGQLTTSFSACSIAVAAGSGVPLTAVCGRWPDVAPEIGAADVVTCHHVLYNVADLGPFVAELTTHARRRVVVEITARHPLTSLNPLWEQFHGLRRPDVPTADDAVAILEALGLAPSHEAWTRPRGVRVRVLR